MLPRRTPVWAAALVLVASAPAARAAEGLRQPLTALIDELAPELKAKNITAVNLVQPVGPKKPLANATPGGVRAVATEVLAAAGFKVDPECPDQITIDYSKAAYDADETLTGLDVEVAVSNAGNPLGRKEQKLADRFRLDWLSGNLSSPLDAPLHTFAAMIAQELAALGKSEIELQSVYGPDGDNSGMRMKLRTALERQTAGKEPLKVVHAGADYKLRVTYRIAGAKAADAVYVFKYDLVDSTGTVVKAGEGKPAGVVGKEKDKDPDGLKTLALAAPMPGGIPPGQTDEQRLQAYLDRLAKRTKAEVTVTDGAVRSAPNGLYGVEIWSGGKRVEPKMVNGHAVVLLDLGAEYQVVLRNYSKRYAAADVSIDGLSMFALRKTPGVDLVAVGPGGGTVPGWYESNDKHYAFKLGAADDSPAVKKLGTCADTGSITVTVQAAWDSKEGPPADERVATGKPRSGLMGTTAGAEGKSEYKDVTLQYGGLRDVIVIRYAPKN